MQSHDNEPSTGVLALRRGVSAARAGLRTLAAIQFERAAESSPDDPNVWLWLAWVANSPDNAIRCLERVLELSPGHSAATAGLIWSRSLSQDTPLEPVSLAPPKTDPVESVIPDVLVASDSGSESTPIDTVAVAAETEIVQENLESTFAHEPVTDFVPEEVVDPPGDSSENSHLALPPAELSMNRDSEPDHTETEESPALVSSAHGCSDLVHRDSQPMTNANAWPSLTPPPLPTMAPPPLPNSTAPPLEVTSSSFQSDSQPTTRSRFQELFAANSRAPEDSTTKLEVAQESNADVDELANSFNPFAIENSQDGRPLVMIVDDSPTVRKLVTLTLERRGFRVVSAFDGVAAIKELGACRPDLILLDINMPRLDGYRLCKLIKKHEATQSIPVVMLSGKDGMFDKLRGRLVGCSDYITKPFEADSLTHKVAKYLSPASSSL